jgi:hypothetical protein
MRLHRGGDRQRNCALHRIAVTRVRTSPRTRATSTASKPRVLIEGGVTEDAAGEVALEAAVGHHPPALAAAR